MQITRVSVAAGSFGETARQRNAQFYIDVLSLSARILAPGSPRLLALALSRRDPHAIQRAQHSDETQTRSRNNGPLTLCSLSTPRATTIPVIALTHDRNERDEWKRIAERLVRSISRIDARNNLRLLAAIKCHCGIKSSARITFINAGHQSRYRVMSSGARRQNALPSSRPFLLSRRILLGRCCFPLSPRRRIALANGNKNISAQRQGTARPRDTMSACGELMNTHPRLLLSRQSHGRWLALTRARARIASSYSEN